MLRGTRENNSFLALITNGAGVAVLCFLLLGSTVVAVIPQPTLHSTLLSSAYAQETEEEGDGTNSEEEEQQSDGEQTTSSGEEEQQEIIPEEIFFNLQTLVDLIGITAPPGLQQIVQAEDSEDLAELAGTSDTQELEATPGITDAQAVDTIAEAPDLEGLAGLADMTEEELIRALFPEGLPTEEPPTEEPPTEEPPTEEPPTDTTAPEVTSTQPADGATDIPLDVAAITATFNEPVQGVDDSSFTVDGITGEVTYDSDSDTATFTPSSELEPETEYTASLSSAITDAAGNPLAATQWSFTTGTEDDELPPPPPPDDDTTAPEVTSTQPADGATDVSITSINATFNEPVQGVDDSSFTVNQGDAAVEGTVDYDSDSDTATFTPSSELEPETEYTASLSSAITDAAGNPLAATQWSFTTGTEDDELPPPPPPDDDTTAPEVTSTQPADGATDVSITSINATFNEPVQGVDDSSFTVDGITGEVTYDSDSDTATFTPSSELEPETEYTASLSSAITDAAGNPLAATQWSFTTGTEDDELPPPPPPDDDTTEPGGTDRFGIDEIYATASNGPTWYIQEQEDPTDDGHFYLSMYRGTTFSYRGGGVWNVDATSGTQEHGIRMHVDSPSGTWKNTEMTGYFQRNSGGSDQFTMIARHGPSYHDDNGCHAYGYYGMTAIDGNVFFKKKLYHFNDGYTKRLAQVDALSDLSDGRWIGMKFIVYDLPNGDVKLELWIDDGDMTNNWQKETELIDEGNLAVEGGDDCGRDATDKIDSGTRATFRVDNMDFDFKKLSVREIQASGGAEAARTSSSGEDAQPADEQPTTSNEEDAQPADEQPTTSNEEEEEQQETSEEEAAEAALSSLRDLLR